MTDRSIPFYNVIMRCRQYERKTVRLPGGYRILPYHPGDEKAWAELEYAVGDFAAKQEAEQYFVSTYRNSKDTRDIFFLKDAQNKVIGSCIAWADQKGGLPVNSLHWLVVDETSRRCGFGRALCEAAMNRFYEKNRGVIYLHTQPWSFAAILLYLSEGFKLVKRDTFAAYSNQYSAAMQALEPILTPAQYELLVKNSEE